MRLLHLLTPVALVSQPVLADCRVFPGFTFDSKHGQVMVSEVRIDAAPGLILRYRASSEINTDGSAISYNLDGTDAGALNTMCNGTNAVLADGSRYSGVVTDAEKASAAYARLDAAAKREFGRQKCRRLLELFSAARRTGFDPRRFPRMDFYAVARARDGRPCLLPGGFLVSQTKAVADPTIRDNCNPAKWLDPLKISAVVMPRTSPFTAHPGHGIDSGNLVLARKGRAFVQAVVGDKGPVRGLGEITPKLGWRLNGVVPDPSNLPLGSVKTLLPRSHVKKAEYFIFTQASVAYGPLQFPPAPARRRAAPINEASIRAAFDRLGAQRVEADLDKCVFPD